MIEQYLPNNNETTTGAFRQKFCQLNNPVAAIKSITPQPPFLQPFSLPPHPPSPCDASDIGRTIAPQDHVRACLFQRVKV
jgi:hypothetical protein